MNTIIASTLVVSCVALVQPARFSFAGLDLSLTVKELRVKYPQSQIAGDELVYVSAKDSHDHISTIRLSGNRTAKSLHITFERRRRDGTPTYPRCASVRANLEKRYGRPTTTADAQEERSANRRFEWTTPAETLTLSCFRMPREPIYAERITIVSRG